MTVIHFYCPIAVQPKQSMRMRVVNGRPMSYPSPKVSQNAKALAAAFKPYAPSKPWTGPVELDVRFWMPFPKATSKRKRETIIWHDKKPDRGNLLKQIEDVLEACGFVENDSQFCVGSVAKCWGEEPAITVVMRQVAAGKGKDD